MDMRIDFRQSKWLGRWALIFACWTLYSLYFAAHAYFIQRYEGGTVSWWRTMSMWLTGGYIWALLTPLIIRLARRYTFTRRTWGRALCIHLGWAACFNFLVYALFLIIYAFVFFESNVAEFPFWENYSYSLVANSQYQFLKYWVVVGLVQSYDYYRKYRERELKAAQLETELAQAQLDALRTQLNPHFLFNTLNSISVLMKRDVEAADRMLLQLSGLLRLALSKNEAHEIPLRQELEFLERYLQIEQTRFRDRLTVRMEIDPAALPALVPQLIFQPLVENAIKHGIADREADGMIEIRAERRNGQVCLQVRDNGPGLNGSVDGLSAGVGLSNTRARLDHLYGADGRLELSNAAEGGLIVAATLPFHSKTNT